jgi:hypothetical protein
MLFLNLGSVLQAAKASFLGPHCYVPTSPWRLPEYETDKKYLCSKGGIKLHALLGHDGYIPAFIKMTTAKVAYITVAKLLN